MGIATKLDLGTSAYIALLQSANNMHIASDVEKQKLIDLLNEQAKEKDALIDKLRKRLTTASATST